MNRNKKPTLEQYKELLNKKIDINGTEHMLLQVGFFSGLIAGFLCGIVAALAVAYSA